MAIIKSRVNPDSKEFKDNYAHNKQLVEKLREQLKEVHKGGPDKARELHGKRGKLMVRERISKLIDSGASDQVAVKSIVETGILNGVEPLDILRALSVGPLSSFVRSPEPRPP